MSIPGLALGRVVFYTPSIQLDDATHLSDENYVMIPVVQGRISRIHDLEKGVVTVSLDVPPDLGSSGYSYGMTYNAIRRDHDEKGRPGTWRFPPRV